MHRAGVVIDIALGNCGTPWFGTGTVSQQQIGLRLCADFKLGTGGIPRLNQGGFICFVDVQQLIKIGDFVDDPNRPAAALRPELIFVQQRAPKLSNVRCPAALLTNGSLARQAGLNNFLLHHFEILLR
jgi:hypothetical protein